MKTKTLTTVTQALVSLLPLLFLALIWNQLPESVPMHYNMHNQPDRMGSKAEMVFAISFLALVGFGVGLLLRNIHKIDPKHKYHDNAPLMLKIAWTTVIFIAVLGVFIVYQTLMFTKNQDTVFSGKGALVLVALIFVVLGNFLNNVKPNYFVGFRTPWNLENEENWRKTHHLAAKLMFFGGLLMVALILVLPEPITAYVFFAGIVPIVLIPFVYSYLLFKREKQ
jgi:uncharacterized membrane protein